MEKNVIVLFLDPREEYEIVIVEGAPVCHSVSPAPLAGILKGKGRNIH